jgi:hypothetical protein
VIGAVSLRRGGGGTRAMRQRIDEESMSAPDIDPVHLLKERGPQAWNEWRRENSGHVVVPKGLTSAALTFPEPT